MIDAAFETAHRLFGLNFKPVDVPLYHPDARAWMSPTPPAGMSACSSAITSRAAPSILAPG